LLQIEVALAIGRLQHQLGRLVRNFGLQSDGALGLGATRHAVQALARNAFAPFERLATLKIKIITFRILLFQIFLCIAQIWLTKIKTQTKIAK